MLRDFKRPDLRAPRYRPPTRSLLNKAFFEKVRQHSPLTAGLDDQLITRILDVSGELIQEAVVAHRDGVALPEQLGFLFIGATPATRKRNIDYKTSAALGKEVHYNNWETDGLTGKLFYTNHETRYHFKYHELWKFTAVRQLKKAVSAGFRKAHTRYVRIDHWMRVSRLLRQQQRRPYAYAPRPSALTH